MRELQPSHYLQQLQPLRIPAGWTVGWHTFQAGEIPPDGFAGSSLLYLIRHDGRLVIDLEWRPEFDPNGHYHAYVQRQPLRTNEVIPDSDDEILDFIETRSRVEVVAWLETWLGRGLDEAPPPEFGRPTSPRVRALRICSGWTLLRNSLTETAPAPASGDPLLFRAVAKERRFRLDVIQERHDDSASYAIELLYAPWPRTDRGRRRVDLPLTFDRDTRLMHRSSAADYNDLIRYLEAWLCRASAWAVEGH